MTVFVNHFARLGINIGADQYEIKKAYHTLAKKWHPDKNKDEGATEKFQKIVASFEFLSSKDRREMHERELKNQAETASQILLSKNNRMTKASPSSTHKSEKTGNASKSKSFTQSYQSQQRKHANSNKSDAFTFTTRSKPGNFSYDSLRKDECFTTSEDVFDVLFGVNEGFSQMTIGTNFKSKKTHRQRHVAPETGNVIGLDETYLFSPREQSSIDRPEDKLPCPWCGGTFTKGKMHEEKCGKFGVSAEEDEESDNDERFHFKQFRQFYSQNLPTWQQQHEELIYQVRQDKLKHRRKCSPHTM